MQERKQTLDQVLEEQLADLPEQERNYFLEGEQRCKSGSREWEEQTRLAQQAARAEWDLS